ncbi:hypothetical protein DO021_22345 [Desulfobacter hydrogenophilus]|uniref:Uncharacterized protein n=1 Tax=Desulfobacter hydrogenophilus TaxID=2291 RepID=A0A328F9M9_9BACT|nr:hypothetical protein DO021_22345 [Desulfobacter hydrogenophilus]
MIDKLNTFLLPDYAFSNDAFLSPIKCNGILTILVMSFPIYLNFTIKVERFQKLEKVFIEMDRKVIWYRCVGITVVSLITLFTTIVKLM